MVVARRDDDDDYVPVPGWPSGLRRCVQVVSQSEAWVRILPDANQDKIIFFSFFHFVRLAKWWWRDVMMMIMWRWGYSSIGRARALQARGTGIETRYLQMKREFVKFSSLQIRGDHARLV